MPPQSVVKKIIIRIEALSFKQFALSLLFVYIIFYNLLLATHKVNTIRILTTVSIGARTTITNIVNGIAMESLGRSGVFYVHGIFAFLTYLAAFYILLKIRPSKIYLLIFSLFLSSHLLWQEEVIAVRDTIPFGLFLTIFFAVIVSDFSLVKRFILLGLISGLGWLTRTSGVIFIPMLFIVPMTIPRHTLRQKCFGLLICVSVFCITISPWQIPYLKKTGRLGLSSWPGNGIYNCVKGNNSLSADIYPYIDLDLIEKPLENHVFVNQKNTALQPVYSFITEQPWKFIWLKIKNAFFYPLTLYVPFGYGKPHFTNNKIIISDFSFHHTYRTQLIIFNFLPLIIFLLYMCYFLNIGKHKKTEKETYFKKMLLIMSFFYLLLHLIVWCETRFILPIHPLWFICAAIYFGDKFIPLLFKNNKPASNKITS
jgi:hypothetical protein